MIGKYVLQGFKRHKVRTAIMVVALAFVATMLVLLSNVVATSRRQTINLAARNAGEYDIVIQQADTNLDPYLDIELLSGLIRQAHPAVEAVYGRIQASVEIARGAQGGAATLLARDPQADTLGSVQIIDGEYNLEGDHIVVLQETAQAYNLKVGDELYLNYLVPESRERGHDAPTNASVRRRSHRFVVAGIATQRGLDGGLQNGILANLETVQAWLGIPGRAERLVVVLDPGAYDAASSQMSAVRVRRVAEVIRAALSDGMVLGIPKAQAMAGSDDAFSIMQTLTIIYGFLSMGVVGLLVYSLINANVDDRRRDLAFMRILGAPQRSLFALVLIEVGLIGAVGVGLGILIGQALSTLVVERMLGSLLPMIVNGVGLDGLPALAEIELVVSPRSLLSTALIAGVVLLLSALAPAIKAATTKVRYAIAPGSADSLQIEDLARLRVRRFDWKITIAGLTLTMMWGMLFLNQLFMGTGDNESAVVAFAVVGMILMILGVSLLFFVLTLPFEHLVLALMGLISPCLTFFSSRNVCRAKRRSTTITLMIVFSTTLPTFLGTTAALSSGNVDVSTRQNNGAPVVGQVANTGMNIFMYFVGFFSSGQQQEGLRSAVLSEFAAVPGVGPITGLTQAHSTGAHNLVRLLDVGLDVHAWTHSPLDVLYPDLTEMVGDGRAAFQQMFRQPDAIILTADVAEYLDVRIGDKILVNGKGKDHQVEMTVVGLVKRMPGFWNIGRGNLLWGSSPAFVSLDTYLRLVQDPTQGSICPGGVCSDDERDQPVIERVFAGIDPAMSPSAVADVLRMALSDRNLNIQIAQEQIQREQQTFQSIRLGLLALTVLSLITSVMGVFSVIYVTVQTRQTEIGMLKAIGITGRQLVGTFAIESLTATVSAALAGVAAGTGLGYVFYISDNMLRNAPLQPAFDWLTTGTVLAMVVVASLISAAIASRGIVRRRVTEIFRQA